MPLLLALSLTACQTPPKQPEPVQDDATLAFGWTQLQQSTLNHLREQSFGEANINIKQMMAFAGSDPEKWEYIRKAMVSMPPEMATELIDQALAKPFIQQQPEERFAFSRLLTQLKQEAAALALINGVIKDDKQVPYVYWRARLYLLLDEEAKADKDYQWLLKRDSGNPDYIGQYATLLNYLQRDEDALALLQQHENQVDLLFRQIILLLQQGDRGTAEDKLVQLKPLAANADLSAAQKLEIGELAFWLDDHDYSMSLLTSIKSGDQLNAAKLLIGNLLVAQEDFARAAVVFHQVQNGPEEHAIPAYQYEIELHKKQGNTDEALAVANTGLSMFKDHKDLLYSRAMLFESMDDIASLEVDLQRILTLEPDNADALNALGYTWADRDMNLDQAYELILQAHEIRPTDKAILDSVGWIYYKKGDLDQAEKYLRLATANNLSDLESYQHLVIVLQALGKQAEAAAVEAKIAEYFPSAEKLPH